MIYYVTLGFGPAESLSDSLANFYKIRQGGYQFQHIYLDQHYPIRKQTNRTKCWMLCEKYEIEYIDAGKNLGLHKGFNLVLDHVALKDDDFVIALDHDMFPISHGFDMALLTPLMQDPTVVWSTLMFEAVRNEFDKGHPHIKRKIGHIECLELQAPIMNSMCAWSGKFLRKIGGLSEPSEFYGGLEVSMWPKMVSNGWKWVFIRDWREDQRIHLRADPEYRKYKWEHAHDGTWPGDFESYLKAKHPELLEG